jgi:hypothetical protein
MARGELRGQPGKGFLEVRVVAIRWVGWFVASVEPKHKVLLAWGW